MSTVTAQEAVDIMQDCFENVWLTLDNPGVLVYENKSSDIPEEGLWARPVVRHAKSSQATLTDDIGYKRYKVIGSFIVQLFFPLGKGLDGAYTVSEQLAETLRKQKSQVTFRNVTWQEVGPDGMFYMFKLTAEFEYSQVR